MRVPDREAELDASHPAQPSQIPAIRRPVADIARARGAPDAKLVQIILAVSEAASNGVGLGPRADSPGLGLGLGLIAHETDRFVIRAVPEGGTEMVLRFAL